MGPPVSYGGFWQHPGLGQTQDVKPFAQNPFLGDKPPSSIGNKTTTFLSSASSFELLTSD